MGHSIRAIIGTLGTVRQIENEWPLAQTAVLPQGYGMIFLTDALFDGLTALTGASAAPLAPALVYYTEAVHQFLVQSSSRTQLAYFETDYFGGAGVQAGLLYENGRLRIPPRSGEGTVNLLLKELGVRHAQGRDEFDALQLARYRRMPD